jgi:hypothetical protein
MPRMCSERSHYAHLGAGSVRGAQTTGLRSPSEPGGGPVAQRAGPTAIAGPGMRNM